MGSEVIIYCYGAICASMLVFNILYNISLKNSEPRLKKRSGRIEERIKKQIEKIESGLNIDESHLDYITKKLRRVINIIAFDTAMKNIEDSFGSDRAKKYIEQIQPVFLPLALVYFKKENMQAAYFASFLSKYRLRKNAGIDTVQDVMLDFMRKNSFYCRVNALEALYAFGSEENVAEAVSIQDENNAFFHEKVLTEGLLSFTGDHKKLINILWNKFDDFSEKTQLAVLNYIRFKTGDYCEKMYEIMNDKSKDKELRFSAIRYFGKYFYEPAKSVIMSFLSDKDTANWEYAAVSASALSRYGGGDVIKALKDALYSSNWYVRYNAAVSLEERGLGYNDFNDVISGGDRYARDMILYRLSSKRPD